MPRRSGPRRTETTTTIPDERPGVARRVPSVPSDGRRRLRDASAGDARARGERDGPREETPVAYDQGNTFARILRGELAAEPVFENDDALVINDHDPKAPYHALVIAKGHYETIDQFVREATPEQISGFFRAIGEAADRLGIAETGYRLVVNQGVDAGQEVAHLHVHILGGTDLGPVVSLPGDKRARRPRTSREARSMPGEAGERSLEPKPGRDVKSKPFAGPDA